MQYTVVPIRAHDDMTWDVKYIVRGASIKHIRYGRVFSYLLNDHGAIRVFSTEGDAWACAAAVDRGNSPPVEIK